MIMMITSRLVLVLVLVLVAQFRGNLDDRRENVGSEHNFSLKPEADLAFALKLFLPTNFTRLDSGIYTRNTDFCIK